MDENRSSPPAVGGSSLLVMFAVLCLVIFALLSLSTMTADVSLSERSAQAVAEYYAADREAERILALLRQGQVMESVEESPAEGGAVSYRYAVEISDTQELQVQVDFDKDRIHYNIVQWQAVSTGDWQSEEELPVYTG